MRKTVPKLHIDFPRPSYPPPPWDVIRVELDRDGKPLRGWHIVSEFLEDRPPVAIVPGADDPKLEAEQREAALLIAASPVLFMALSATLQALEEPGSVPQPALGEFQRYALDLARGRL